MKKEHLVKMGKIFLISMVAVVTYDKVVKPMIL
jgi:hypothetical protein